jgi:hypothetical protein
MGARATLAHLIPTKPHFEHARDNGRPVAATIQALDRQIADCLALAHHLIDDMRRANPNDPNISTLSTLITQLS